MNDNHPAIQRSRELRQEQLVRHEAEVIRSILDRHQVGESGVDDMILDIVGYYTGMLRADGTRRGRRHDRSVAS